MHNVHCYGMGRRGSLRGCCRGIHIRSPLENGFSFINWGGIERCLCGIFKKSGLCNIAATVVCPRSYRATHVEFCLNSVAVRFSFRTYHHCLRFIHFAGFVYLEKGHSCRLVHLRYPSRSFKGISHGSLVYRYYGWSHSRDGNRAFESLVVAQIPTKKSALKCKSGF